VDEILQYLRDHRAEHLDWLHQICRIPSISTKAEHKQDVRAAIEWTRDLCTRIGLEAEVRETGGHPALHAERCEAEGAPTYLIYGHMDVQPEGDLSLWDAGPFEPIEHDGWLLARGSADDKGQVLVHLRAVAAWLAVKGSLPVNLKFLIEGEEEIASPSLGPFLEKNRDLLRCDQILISDTSMYADGWPAITYGTRGLLYKEIRLSGPKHDLHSGSFGGTIANPANALAEVLAGLHDADGRVTIPGFYDDVVEATAAEREQIRSLPFDEQEYLDSIGSPATCGEKGYGTNERRWIRPTLDVNGIYGGFMAEGANTIIPKSAGAKVSMRLVPNQSGEKLSGMFDDAIRERCPNTVRLEILNHGFADAYMAPLDSRPMRAAKRALNEAFGREPALIREGGSLPILPLFKRTLGVDCLLLGFASPNCNAHGPNEKVYLADLDRAAEAAARLYALLAEGE
jgi:acetylornithine deacetylase/succinyl-diaminopimelate desuccinylase-like protein